VDFRFAYVLEPGVTGVGRAVRRFSRVLDTVLKTVQDAARPRGTRR
jgi:hypothetical protein